MSTLARSIAFLVVLLGCLPPATAEVGERPLPTAESVKASFAARMEEGPREKAAFEARYRYVRSRVREERNSRGKLRERTEERQTHDPQLESSDSGRDAVTAKYGEGDIVVNKGLLDRFIFEVAGREQLQGKDVVRVRFHPADADLPQENTLDRFINRMAGTLWLEESTLELLRAQMGLQEHVNFLGGIAGVVYRLDMTVERAVTPEGLWYTRQSAWRADYRAFLVRKVVDFEERWEEVKCVHPDPQTTKEPARLAVD